MKTKTGRICVIAATAKGRTLAVATEACRRFRFSTELFAAASVPDLAAFDTFILFSPTYGDEELHLEMEDFLRRLDLRDRSFVLCELGNYYGYDEPDFGAARIMRWHLQSLGWKEVGEALSLDALPRLDTKALEAWTSRLSEAFEP